MFDDDQDQEDDQGWPAWTYLSDELGCDCTRWKLCDFLSFVKSNPDALDPYVLDDVLESAQEDLAECRNNGLRDIELFV